MWVGCDLLEKEDDGRAGSWVLSSQELSTSKGTEAEKQVLCRGIREGRGYRARVWGTFEISAVGRQLRRCDGKA